jgi:hypothetical protein
MSLIVEEKPRPNVPPKGSFGGSTVNENNSCEDEGANSAQAPESCAKQGQSNPGYAEAVFDRWTGTKGIYRPAAATVEKLPAGIYTAEQDQKGIYLETKRFPSDYLLDLPGLPTRLILDEVEEFWKKEKRFRQFGFLHKRGIMMCGPGGCGKTSIIRMIASDVIDRGGVVLLVNKIPITILALQAIREIEENRALMTVTEDLDEYFKPEHNPRQILSMFDGENQVDHVIHIATTNYPERLEDRIIQRPSRFDMVLCLGTPNDAAREAYLRNILHDELPESEFQGIVAGTKKLSLSHLKEYVVSTVVLGKDSKETLARLQANMRKKPTLDGKGSVLGFQGEGFRVHYFGEEKNGDQA